MNRHKYSKVMILLCAFILLLLCGACANTGSLDNDDPYTDAKNRCMQFADSVLPPDASVFEFIVEAEPLAADADVSGFTYIAEGEPDAVVRIGGDETDHTDGSDNCYVDFLYELNTDQIIAYQITMK